jgi:hypothetical protein
VDRIEILREIHEDECGHHATAKSLVAKAFYHGFYWPKPKADADKIVELCQGLQMYSKQTHIPATIYHPYNMAFCSLGARHGGTVENSTFGIYAPFGGGR